MASINGNEYIRSMMSDRLPRRFGGSSCCKELPTCAFERKTTFSIGLSSRIFFVKMTVSTIKAFSLPLAASLSEAPLTTTLYTELSKVSQ